MNLSSGMSADKSADASTDVLGRISTNIILHFEEIIGLTNQILPGIYLNSPEENSDDE